MKNNMKFDDWLKAVDAECDKQFGCSYKDLPDCPFRDWYENGVSPKNAAKRAKKYADEN